MNPYRKLLLFNLLLVIVVLALFYFISDRQVAALIAGVLFILSPILILRNEWRARRSLRTVPALTAWLFLLIATLPIILLRVCNWGVPFDELSLFGVPAPQLHRASNGFFLLMLASLWWESVHTTKRV